MNNQFSGSCLCAQIKFEIIGDFDQFFLCHCKYCQKDTGSAHAANLFSTTAKLIWISGENNIKTFNLPGTMHSKSFCKECGSAVPNHQLEGKLLVAPAGSFDSALTLKPQAHIFCSSKASWENEFEKIKTFETFPS